MVHIGSRAQASVCLSCPGISLDHLEDFATSNARRAEPKGLEQELDRVAREFARFPVQNWLRVHQRQEEALRRRLEREDRWESPEDLRSRLQEELPFPEADDFPANPPPPKEEGLESLPLFYEEGTGIVALSDHPRGWEVLSIRESGGIGSSLSVLVPPDRPPRLDASGERLLRGYLGLIVQRDQLLWSAYAEVGNHEEATLGEVAEEIVREAATQVLTRAVIRAQLRGTSAGVLSREDVARGIRATDSDLLDLPTLGRVL